MSNILMAILFLKIIADGCLAEIVIEVPDRRESADFPEATVQILKRCYARGVNAIGIAGNCSGAFVTALSRQEFVSAILLGNIGSTASEKSSRPISRDKLQIFLVTVSSSEDLERILTGIKASRWWNHMAYLYIIGWPTTKKDCSRARDMLRTAWKIDLIEAKFMCAHTNETRLIYSFNPYTSYAPKAWRLESIDGGGKEHPWSLLVREYREDDPRLCDNIDFDKSLDLGGYEIRSTIKEWDHEIHLDRNKTGLDALVGTDATIIRTIFQALNAKPKYVIHGRDEIRGYLEEDGKPRGILADMVNGISDLGLNDRYRQDMSRLTIVSSHWTTSAVIMTRYSGHASQLSKILSLLDGASKTCLGLVCLVTLFFLKYWMRQHLTNAVLNALRMICSSSLAKLPRDTPPRIYLASFFLFLITIQGLYQGKLASLLSKQIRRPNIDTMIDLAESDYKIYGNEAFRVFFNDEAYAARYFDIEGYNCTKYVVNDPTAACIFDKHTLLYEAARMKFHLSRESVVQTEVCWVIRENWPLERRLSTIFRRLVESHFIQHTIDNLIQEPIRMYEANEIEDKDRSFKVLTVDDLSFAFIILGNGLSFAALAFVLEIMLERLASRAAHFLGRFSII